MREYHVDMTGPDPTHEAAYTRILKVIRGNRDFIDALVKATPSALAGNWKLALVRRNADIVTLKGLWQADEEFRGYLREKLAFHFGDDYTKSLIRIFLA